MDRYIEAISVAFQNPLCTAICGVGALTAVGYYILNRQLTNGNNNKKPIHIPIDIVNFDCQSTILPGPERIRAATWETHGDPTQFFTHYRPEVRTVYDNFLWGLKVSDNGDCLGTRRGPSRDYVWITYRDVITRAQQFGAGLVNIGAAPGQSTLVGIYSQNREEYDISILGIVAHARILVPLYDTLGPEAITYVLKQTEMAYCIADTVSQAKQLLQATQTECDNGSRVSLRHIILIDAPTVPQDYASLKQTFTDVGITLHSFADVVRSGATDEVPLSHLPSPDHTYIICYTSGTTGNPKGVELSHANMIAQAATVEAMLKTLCGGLNMHPNEDFSSISYLPMAHMFEQITHILMFGLGYKIGFYGGDIKGLTDDLKTLKPRLLPVVPRLLNRIYDVIQGRLDSGSFISRLIWSIAYKYKFAQMQKGIFRWDSIFDRLIFDKIRSQLGGRVDIMVTGSAPIAGEVMNTCRLAFGCTILEAYGQTECTGSCTISFPGDYSTGHVGAVIPSAHVKLVDVPELDYYSKDDKGEVCVRGPLLMKGYFRDPAKTAEAIDVDGWLHTGDIGTWLPNGTLKVIDRKKHIFKLAQGEYVAPEKIEAVYVRCPVVTQVFVDGNSLERQLVAIVVPDASELSLLINEKGIALDTQFDRKSNAYLKQLCADKRVCSIVLEVMKAMGKECKLNPIEQVGGRNISHDKTLFPISLEETGSATRDSPNHKHIGWKRFQFSKVAAIHLETEAFSIENGLLTPTFKSQRPKLRRLYQPVMDRMYEELKRRSK